MRFVVAMGETIRAENVLPGGQSGAPGAPHYTDQLDLWVENRTHPILFDEEEIKAAAVKVERFVAP